MCGVRTSVCFSCTAQALSRMHIKFCIKQASAGSFRGKPGTLVKRVFESQGILVTTYEQLRIHHTLLHSQQWSYLVLDEGHKIRNPDIDVCSVLPSSRNHRAIPRASFPLPPLKFPSSQMTLKCKSMKTHHRLAVTGAPIQNKVALSFGLDEPAMTLRTNDTRPH